MDNNFNKISEQNVLENTTIDRGTTLKIILNNIKK